MWRVGFHPFVQNSIFAERQHYATYGKHLVKDTFCALERGPVPSFLYDAVKVATNSAHAVKGSLLQH